MLTGKEFGDNLPVMLAVAGSDPGGGAGIQADVKTAFACGAYCAAAVTCVTVQNSRRFSDSYPVDADIVRRQIEAVLEDHISNEAGCEPTLKAVKIGMLPDSSVARAVKEALLPVAGFLPIVLDPIVAPTLRNGGDEVNAEMRSDFLEEIIRLSELATISTPNKAENLLFLKSGGLRSGYILEKGGHDGSVGDSVDILYQMARKENAADHNQYIEVRKFSLPQIDTFNSHGTGCVLSSAIAAELAKGCNVEDAVGRAKQFLHGRLKAGAGIQFGVGSVSDYGPAFML